MTLCWPDKLRNLLQTLAFCLAISAIQYALQSQRSYEVFLVYGLCIGCMSWVFIDFGRHLFASAADTGWPQGLAGVALPLVGIASGYVLGTLLGDQWFGCSSWSGAEQAYFPASIITTMLAGGSCTYYFYAKNKAAHLERHIAEARSHTSEARLKLLETQLEPHMLFNTLANLRALIAVDPERAQHMLDRLVAYLRATLAASRTTSGTHTLQAEFDRLHDYLELMAVRMGPRLRYTLDLPPELATQHVPPLLLQALVENSIQHGLEPQVGGGAITITARSAGTQLTLEVQDNGVGSPTDLNRPTDSASGFGVAQVRERLRTSFGDQATIKFIAADAGGTRAIIRFPLSP